jgi:hypothetical protein
MDETPPRLLAIEILVKPAARQSWKLLSSAFRPVLTVPQSFPECKNASRHSDKTPWFGS